MEIFTSKTILSLLLRTNAGFHLKWAEFKCLNHKIFVDIPGK